MKKDNNYNKEEPKDVYIIRPVITPEELELKRKMKE